MTDYIDVPVTTDPDELATSAFAYLQGNIPNWLPYEGAFDVWLIEAIARIASEVRDVASLVPTTIFRYVGANLFETPPLDATVASVTSTWTAIDNAGYTIKAGTQVGIRASGDILVAFLVLADVSIAPGATTTTMGGVTLVAVEAGVQGSGLVGIPSGKAELIDPLEWVTDISLTGQTTGGTDAEADTDYLDRLRVKLRTLAPRPILPEDFSLLARDVPGVWRAATIDGFNPANATTNNERMVTVIGVDEAGQLLSSGVKAQLQSYLDGLREISFIVNVADPIYISIDVAYVVQSLPGFVQADVKAAIDAALLDYLNPKTWGSPKTGTFRELIPQPAVRYLEVAEIVNSVPGVDYIVSLQLGLHGGGLSSADIPTNFSTTIAMVQTQQAYITGTVN